MNAEDMNGIYYIMHGGYFLSSRNKCKHISYTILEEIFYHFPPILNHMFNVLLFEIYIKRKSGTFMLSDLKKTCDASKYKDEKKYNIFMIVSRVLPDKL